MDLVSAPDTVLQKTVRRKAGKKKAAVSGG
jgi:hypothetical protein